MALHNSHHLKLSELIEVLAVMQEDAFITVERVRSHNKGEIRTVEQVSAYELRDQFIRAHEEGHLPGGDREIMLNRLGKKLVAHHDGVFWLEPLG